MKKIIIAAVGILSGFLWASQELWVVYHAGCPRCEAFMTEVVSSYPDANLLDPSVFLPLKLLNASLPMHQELIYKIKPPIYSTPTFIRVEKNAQSEVTVLDRWVGYNNTEIFYKKLSESLAMDK